MTDLLKILQDVVNMKSEDPATPRLSEGGQGEKLRGRLSIVGAHPLGSLRKPRDRNDSPILV